MSSKTTTFFILLVAAFAIGCNKSADSAANTDTNKPASTGTADKPADTTGTTDTSKPDTTTAGAKGDMNGTWESDDPSMKGVTIEFKDGDMTMTGEYPGAEMKGVTMEAHATLKVDGDKGTMTPGAVKLTAPADASADMKKKVDDANKMLSDPAMIKKQKPNVGTIAWVDKDTFTVTDDATKKTTTFKRKS